MVEPHLLIQVFQLGSWQFELCNLGQQYIPSACIDVCYKSLNAVNSVEEYLTLILQEHKTVGHQQLAWLAPEVHAVDLTLAGAQHTWLPALQSCWSHPCH
eukprot:GHRR01031551.1.p1 GENE.GHRR01031551.1~~GHRR01031551.1.p1  ORF type:complete len:100 (-),score=32.86 GHRR01031551.1:415-714(-)